ncbi:hypothetical protein [Tenacibaculum ovolyticum]|uniref:hypothetical protein n=1 Tax=Tenacibaculum ovolyticum TaxID=104270 RepID=UPI003BAD91F3
MVWKKKIIIILISCCFSGCYNYTYKNGGHRPKKNKFTLAKTPYNLKKEDLIKTENLYFSNDTLTFGNGEYNSLFYIKFFKNGRCFERSVDISEKTDIEKLNTATTPGYYKVINNNKIEIEFFYVKHKERSWYSKFTGFIRNDTLFIKGTYKQEQEVLRAYIPEKIKGLKQTTDW